MKSTKQTKTTVTMTATERETMIEWLSIMTDYSKSFLKRASDDELERLYATNSRVEV